MNIRDYLKVVLKTEEDPFVQEDLVIPDDFDTKELICICNIALPRERLNVAWAMIISAFINRFSKSNDEVKICSHVLDFLIENRIELVGLCHLHLPKNYLLRIYEKDNSCFEALLNIKK